MSNKIHARSSDERQLIELNESNQPVGPNDKVCSEFSSFLGTVARSASYCPLNYGSWLKVPDKESIWEYVLKKYIVPPQGKKWVLATVAASWRCYKCRLKKKFYSKYDTDRARLQNRPNSIPESQFQGLLKLWSSEEGKKKSATNKAVRAKQKYMHSMGRKSFARVRHTMEWQSEQPVSDAQIFIETRMRKGKQPHEETSQLIDQLKSLESQQPQSGGSCDPMSTLLGEDRPGRVRFHGKGVTRSLLKQKGASSSKLAISSEELKALKDEVKDEVKQEIRAEVKEEVKRELQAEFDACQVEMARGMALLFSQLKQSFPTIPLNDDIFKLLTVGKSPGTDISKIASSCSVHEPIHKDRDDNEDQEL